MRQENISSACQANASASAESAAFDTRLSFAEAPAPHFGLAQNASPAILPRLSAERTPGLDCGFLRHESDRRNIGCAKAGFFALVENAGAANVDACSGGSYLKDGLINRGEILPFGSFAPAGEPRISNQRPDA